MSEKILMVETMSSEIKSKIPFFDDKEFYEYVSKELKLALDQNGEHKIPLSGNPYSDNAIIIVSILFKEFFKEDVKPTELKLKHIIEVFGYSSGNLKFGKEFARINFLCKSTIYMLFPNNPIIQAAYRKNSNLPELKAQGENYPSIKQEHIYIYYLLSFIRSINNSKSDFNCSFCGNNEIYMFHDVDEELNIFQNKSPETFNIGLAKYWYPLIGTIGGEAQSFHGFTEQPKICGVCLILVHFLPQGVSIFKGLVALYITNDLELTQDLIRLNIEQIRAQYITNPNNWIKTPGAGENVRSFYIQLLNLFDIWVNQKNRQNLEIETSLMLWLFTNSNQEVKALVEELPNTLLQNLYQFNKRWGKDIRNFLTRDERNYSNFFIDKMKEGREYYGFYSDIDNDLPNLEFFENYQLLVIERDNEIISFYKLISKSIIENKKREDLNSIIRSNDRSKLRQIIYEQIFQNLINEKIDVNIILHWVMVELPKDGMKPFFYYLHPKASFSINFKEINSEYENEIWHLFFNLAKRYYMRASRRGGYNKNSYIKKLHNENTSIVRTQLRGLSREIPGFTWKKLQDYEILLQNMPDRSVTAFLLFRIAAIDFSINNEKIEDKIHFSNIQTIENIKELEDESLLTEGLLNIIYSYIKHRSIDNKFSINRAVDDLIGLLSVSKKSFESFCNFLSYRGIQIDEFHFYNSQISTEYYLGKSNHVFSWFNMRTQILSFLNQIKYVDHWDLQIKSTLEELS
jgi:hypothetical protein